MAFYQLLKTHKIPASRSDIWAFISNPGIFKKIATEAMGFIITCEIMVDRMYPGMIITYKVSPVPGIEMKGVTEITHVKDYEYFVDERWIGPYAMWHHQHKIEPIEGGILMTDIVTYQPPFGVLGALANKLFIKNAA